MRLQGKVAVITGAASGMGLAMATLFAAEGAAVVAGDESRARHPDPDAERDRRAPERRHP